MFKSSKLLSNSCSLPNSRPSDGAAGGAMASPLFLHFEVHFSGACTCIVISVEVLKVCRITWSNTAVSLVWVKATVKLSRG